MANLMAAIGSLLVLLGFTTLIIATIRHFFPSFDTLAGLLLLYLT